MRLDGVIYLGQSNTVFFGFEDAAALNNASAAAGWTQFDQSMLILDAGRPNYGPNDSAVFIVRALPFMASAISSIRVDVIGATGSVSA